MMGSVGLKGPSAAAAIARQRMAGMSRSSRSISTFRSQNLRLSSQRGQLKSALSGSAPWRMAPAVVGPAAIRFNSTSSTSTPAEFVPEASGSDSLTNLPDIVDITTIPERIGYLKELGLDFGWGSTSIMQYLIEHIHIYSGLPWWASIMAVGVLSRVVLFKAVMNASENAARMSVAKPKIDPLQKRMVEISREGGGLQEQQVVRAQMKEIHKEYGISTWKSLIPMLQIPLGFGCFRIVRGMTSLPVPGMATEHAGWIQDLTIADPTYFLPAIAASTLILTLKRGGDTGQMPMMESSAGKSIMYGLPAISFTFMAFMPSALQLYFVATGIFGLCQTYIINSPAFRKWAGMTTAKKRAAFEPSQATQNVQSKALRLTLERIEKAKADQIKAQKEQIALAKNGGGKISFIDRIMNNGKDLGKTISTEISEKFGTKTIGERELAERKKRAQEYEEERKAEDEALRIKRNEERRLEHQKILQQERNKASDAWRASRAKGQQRGSRRA